ncbi:MAG: dehydrogenase, partial [Verrucomicrobiae bacterium]|nr:dehydrogenase [Verrucomicrobiae bacterium]
MPKHRLFLALWSPAILLVGYSLFGQASDDPLDPSNAISNLELYPGVSATLFASEPAISSVTNLDIDHRGRVWVCEVMNYREHGEKNTRPEGDRILILEDRNGDGEADSVKTYYQGHDVDAALGICVIGNQVIVTCAPNILIFTDENGDDIPDRKEYLFTETGRIQTDHSTHSVTYGPDGKLYWNFGNLGKYVHDKNGKLVIDQAGNPVFDKRFADEVPGYEADDSPYWGGMIFRCDPDGSNLETLAHNFRNNYEVAIDSFGGLWQSDNDDDGNYGVRLNYILEYGNYGYREENTGAFWKDPRISQHPEIPYRHWHQNDPGVVPNFVHTGAGSPTGITVYEGDLLPPIFRNQVIHCDAGPGV